jgi:hypothetical protein
MLAIRFLAGTMLVLCICVFALVLLSDRVIKREEKRHQIAMDNIKEKDKL